MKKNSCRMLILLLFIWSGLFLRTFVEADEPETLAQIGSRLSKDTAEAYNNCKFSAFSKNYFNRFSLDPKAVPSKEEVVIDSRWVLVLPQGIDPLGHLMAAHFQEFLKDRLGVEIMLEERSPDFIATFQKPAIILFDSGGGDPDKPESFTIKVTKNRVTVRGDSPNGLRDGIVRLVDRIGFRQAPILKLGSITYTPRLAVRLGAIPKGGSYKDVVFFGYNSVFYGGGDLYAFSQSNAIPELAVRRVPGMLKSSQQGIKELGKYGLKAYAWLKTRQKFPKDDPVFKAHPEIRGALTWRKDGEYTLCTSHPLVRRYLRESVQDLFRSLDELQGVVLIVGGEGFYHCHMRPYGVKKGHTNCARCEPLGAEAAVADLCNDLADAARSINPNAEIVLWPYSAEYVWAADHAVTGFLEKLKPGTALFTEIEKSEILKKPQGVRKSIWDYSIDLIGPGPRAKKQIATCVKHDIKVYLKSEPELGFEAPRLPQIPCMDRWFDRAEALASCNADGAWVFPAFRPFYGTSTGEANKFLWWTPVPEREELLQAFAKRIAGVRAGDKLRQAWKEVSKAIPYSPELPPYYTGPYYLGPMHPMCADKKSPLPEVFYGHYLFYAELKDSEGLKKRPTFFTDPRGNVPVFGEYYRNMEKHLRLAVEAIREASPLVEERCRLTFDAEALPIQWFFHTVRSHANFYESCQIRDRLLALQKKKSLSEKDKTEALKLMTRWRKVLEDEKENTIQALPILEQDMRLDPYYGGDHTFSHGKEMIKAKLTILNKELSEFLPSLEKKYR